MTLFLSILLLLCSCVHIPTNVYKWDINDKHTFYLHIHHGQVVLNFWTIIVTKFEKEMIAVQCPQQYCHLLITITSTKEDANTVCNWKGQLHVVMRQNWEALSLTIMGAHTNTWRVMVGAGKKVITYLKWQQASNIEFMYK